MASKKDAFLTVARVENPLRPINVRIHDFEEIEQLLPTNEREMQASRCMDCGVPFCHWGCPVANKMPEWQAMIVEGDWKGAYDNLSSTNNFPEFTGRVCPAPCESACVAGINDPPVTIRQNELAVVERAFDEGYIKPNPPKVRTGKKVAVIGSGPAGLACADNLNKAGHTVTLFESAEKVGGYLRYGIPDFKLDKKIIDRRVDIMEAEGLIIKTGVNVGTDITGEELMDEFDAVCVTIGARAARDLPVEGRELSGIHFAMEFLGQQNRVVSGESFSEDRILATDKHVVVVGGGDTGSDCIGTSNRHGAKSITQIEILPQPPQTRRPNEPWPLWPKLYKVSSSHEEGCDRMFSVATKRFVGNADGQVTALEAVQVSWEKDENGRYQMTEIPGTGFELKADLVLLAMGFVHVMQDGLVKQLGVDLDNQGNISVDNNFMSSVDGVFAAGDSKRGASLVVWAITEGRQAAAGVDSYLRSL